MRRRIAGRAIGLAARRSRTRLTAAGSHPAAVSLLDARAPRCLVYAFKVVRDVPERDAAGYDVDAFRGFPEQLDTVTACGGLLHELAVAQ